MTDALRVHRTPAPVREQVVENLRQAILGGVLLPGQRLIERELVERTGVSRTSVREALRELAAEGLVTTVANQGTIVSNLTAEDARELYQIRAVLEGLGGRLFVQHAGEADRRALSEAFERVERLASEGSDALAAKGDFYQVLFRGAGNRSLHDVVDGLHARVNLLRSLTMNLPNRAARSVEELRRIVEAVQAGDPDAADAACRAHVEAAGEAGLTVLSTASARAQIV